MADPLAASMASLCGALCGLRDQVTALATVHAAIDEFNGVFGAFQTAMALHASCLSFPRPPPPVRQPPPPRASSGIPKPQIAAPVQAAPRGSTSSTGSAGRPSDGSSGGAAPVTAKPKPASKKRPSGGPPAGAAGPKKKAPASAAPAAAAPPPAAAGRKPSAKSRAAAAVLAQKNARPETAPWKWDKNVRDAIPRKYQSDGELAKLENILIYLKNRQTGVTIADLVKHSGLAVIRCKEMLQTLTKINLIARKQESVGFLYTFGPPSDDL